jgi:hypothetical protein
MPTQHPRASVVDLPSDDWRPDATRGRRGRVRRRGGPGRARPGGIAATLRPDVAPDPGRHDARFRLGTPAFPQDPQLTPLQALRRALRGRRRPGNGSDRPGTVGQEPDHLQLLLQTARAWPRRRGDRADAVVRRHPRFDQHRRIDGAASVPAADGSVLSGVDRSPHRSRCRHRQVRRR